MSIKIKIADDFSPFPAGRTGADGLFNGRKFRTEMLRPKLEEAIITKQKLIVALDGLKTVGSSFFDEAFGGLTRHENFSRRDVLSHLEIEAINPAYHRYRKSILKYIKEA